MIHVPTKEEYAEAYEAREDKHIDAITSKFRLWWNRNIADRLYNTENAIAEFLAPSPGKFQDKWLKQPGPPPPSLRLVKGGHEE